MKRNYDKHVERMENWKDISEEEEWAFNVGLVTLFLMNWEALMLDVMLEFLNKLSKAKIYILGIRTRCMSLANKLEFVLKGI
jgi:hypothetical protein